MIVRVALQRLHIQFLAIIINDNATTKTRHRASTSNRWHFAFALCCHSNETRAPIANPPNSAQLEGSRYHPPSYIRGSVQV